jgi:bile acid-coenzyme A ligase
MAETSHGNALSVLAGRDPDRPALVNGERSITRGELERRSNRRARGFAALGVGVGDFVCIALPNGVEFVESVFATWKLGAVPQPISWHLPAAERAAILELARPALVVGGEPRDGPGVPRGWEPDGALSDAPLPERVSPHRKVMTSGGSTGRPKLIVDTSPARIDPDLSAYTLAPGTRVLIPGPLYHAAPFISCFSTIMVGGFAVLMSRFDPEEALRLIEAHRVQFVTFVPTMLHRIWRLGPECRARHDLSSLERVGSGGAKCPAWLMRAWIDWMGAEKMIDAYGASEGIVRTVITGPEWLEHEGSVGRPLEGWKVRVLDADGRDLPPGEVGEVYVLPPGGQGSTYFYIGEARARVSRDGWETLGDLGYLDADGYLYLVDRRTDLIVTGGANVYPAEVEAALDAHPAVRSCAVIGLPDDDLGARVHAIVQRDGAVDAEGLRAHLRERIDRYKIPRSFEFVEEPLRDDAGKLRRWQLRETRLPPGAR